MGLNSVSTFGEVFYNSMVGVVNFFVLVFVLRLVISLIINMGRGLASMRNQVKGKTGASAAHLTSSGENESPVEQELVYDEICGREIPRQNSYIVATDDAYHFFCSWECRQKFVDSLKQDRD